MLSYTWKVSQHIPHGVDSLAGREGGALLCGRFLAAMEGQRKPAKSHSQKENKNAPRATFPLVLSVSSIVYVGYFSGQTLKSLDYITY